MKKQNCFKTILTLGVAATLLAGTVLAAPMTTLLDSAKSTEQVAEKLQPFCVYGKATSITETQNGGSILLENSNDTDPYQKISVSISDETIILDAVTGETKTIADLKENESLYAYVGPTVAESFPPQASAVLVLCHIPADFSVPKYAEVQAVTEKDDGVDVLMAPSVILHLYKDTELLPYGTDEVPALDDITPGTHLLSWYAVETRSLPPQANPSKVMVFPAAVEAPAVDPLGIVTRQGFIDAIYASVVEPVAAEAAPFADVTDHAAVNWAYANKIILGGDNSLFLPEQNLTREQMMVFLLRYATVLEKGPVGSWAVRITYEDMKSLSDWAYSGAMWNQITGLVKPDADNNILPSNTVTNAEVAEVIAGLLAR